MEKRKWDVSDIDPVTMFLKDCRYYNGGLVATKEERRTWRKPRKQTVTNSAETERKPIIFIDRLRR